MPNDNWKYVAFHNHPSRYVDPVLFHMEFQKLDLAHQEIGRSFQNRPIHLYSTGNGKKKVLIWSQMHGNEPTGTLSLLDIFTGYQEVLSRLNNLTIYILPILNPDGAIAFTRRNAQGVDINRDARELQTPEGQLLMRTIEQLKPDLCLNLHDQRTCFSAGENGIPAVFAVLAPSAGDLNPTNASRKQAIQLLDAYLADVLPNQHISRFTDEYYPTAFGDRLQAMSFCNILLEAGAHYRDIERLESRRMMGQCILGLLHHFNQESRAKTALYESLPLNMEKLEDVILRDVKWTVGGNEWKGQIALRRVEEVKEGVLIRRLILSDQGDLSHKKCHLEVTQPIFLNSVINLESDVTHQTFEREAGKSNFSVFL